MKTEKFQFYKMEENMISTQVNYKETFVSLKFLAWSKNSTSLAKNFESYLQYCFHLFSDGKEKEWFWAISAPDFEPSQAERI